MLNGEYSALAAGSTTGQRENAVPTLRAASTAPAVGATAKQHPPQRAAITKCQICFHWSIVVSGIQARDRGLQRRDAPREACAPRCCVGCRDFYFECMNRTAAPRTTRAPLRAAPHHQIRFSQVSPSAQATARIKMGDPPPAGNARRASVLLRARPIEHAECPYRAAMVGGHEHLQPLRVARATHSCVCGAEA